MAASGQVCAALCRAGRLMTASTSRAYLQLLFRLLTGFVKLGWLKSHAAAATELAGCTRCTRKRKRTVMKTLATFRTLAVSGALALAVVAGPAPLAHAV